MFVIHVFLLLECLYLGLCLAFCWIFCLIDWSKIIYVFLDTNPLFIKRVVMISPNFHFYSLYDAF